jgi:hypothetical protein
MLYTVSADLTSGIADVVQKRDDLGRDIAALAAKNNAQVWFHEFTDPVAGAPIILLECTKDFLAQVKNLPGCVETAEYTWPLATQRSPQIYNYFSTPRKPPRPPKASGPGL